MCGLEGRSKSDHANRQILGVQKGSWPVVLVSGVGWELGIARDVNVPLGLDPRTPWSCHADVLTGLDLEMFRFSLCYFCSWCCVVGSGQRCSRLLHQRPWLDLFLEKATTDLGTGAQRVILGARQTCSVLNNQFFSGDVAKDERCLMFWVQTLRPR